MRIVVVIVFFLVSVLIRLEPVSAREPLSNDDSLCNVERSAARERFKSGEFRLPETREYLYGPYVEEAFFVLFKVKPTVPVWNDVVGLPPSCYDKMIDSLVVAKFGTDAFDRAQLYADDLHSADPQRYGNDCWFSPTYIPNNDSLTVDLRRIIHYPPAAKRDSVQGVVYLSLDIDTTGSVTRATVVKGVRHDLDSTAVDAAMRLGKFHVERRWGIKEAAQIRIPIKFALK